MFGTLVRMAKYIAWFTLHSKDDMLYLACGVEELVNIHFMCFKNTEENKLLLTYSILNVFVCKWVLPVLQVERNLHQIDCVPLSLHSRLDINIVFILSAKYK